MNRFESLPRGRRAALLAAFVTFSLVMVMLLAEGSVRARQWLKHGSAVGKIEELYRYDPQVQLRVPVAGFTNGRISINSHGFRGPEIAMPKPPGTIRIAFLGGSTTFCAEVSSDEATWPHLVIGALQQEFPDRRFDYINSGVPGYPTSASLKNLVHRVAPLDPDIIVIYHASNDLSKFSARLARERGLGAAELVGDKQISWLGRHSMLWYLLEKNLIVWKLQRAANDPGGKLSVSPEVLAEPFRRDLTALATKAEEVAEKVVLVTFSTRLRPEQSEAERRDAAVTSLYYMPHMTPDGLVEAFGAYNDVIRDVAQRMNLTLVKNENAIPADGAHFVDSVHFTDAGSRLMADRVAQSLTRAGIVKLTMPPQHALRPSHQSNAQAQ